jgi:succinoglycan biosynthesis protein ExoW
MILETVIPFYQRRSGLLTTAVESVLDQKHPVSRIIIIDDESPVSAAEELAQARLATHPRVYVKRIRNSGVAAARNTGLECVRADTTAVCFLDSDDRWDKDHLARAVQALTQGYDFIFADHIRDGWATGKFSRVDFNPCTHPLIDSSSCLRHWEGDFALAALLKHLVQTSTVVVRWSILSNIRFPTSVTSFEDDITWIRLYQGGAKACFSDQIGARMGEGVNISLSDGWGTLSEFEKSASLLAAWHQMFHYIQPTDELIALKRRRIHSLQQDLARQFLFGLSWRLRLNAQVLKRFPAIRRGVAQLLAERARRFPR